MSTRRVYTFGHGQPNFPGYVVVEAATPERCRELMVRAYGSIWSMEYPTEEEAGIAKFGVPLRATLSDPGSLAYDRDIDGPAYPEPECWGDGSYEATPGPWREDDRFADERCYTSVIGADGDTIVADVIQQVRRVRCSPEIGDRRWIDDPDTSAANANLIAAAPDLLAACVDLVAYLDLGEARPCGACTPEEMCGYHAIVTDARTAIAKALEGVAS